MQMEAVTIHDIRPLGGGRVLAVDLIDLLRLYEPEVRALSWACRDVWCLGDRADDFHRASDADGVVDGGELVRLASGGAVFSPPGAGSLRATGRIAPPLPSRPPVASSKIFC